MIQGTQAKELNIVATAIKSLNLEEQAPQKKGNPNDSWNKSITIAQKTEPFAKTAFYYHAYPERKIKTRIYLSTKERQNHTAHALRKEMEDEQFN